MNDTVEQVLSDLITAFHILHQRQVLDEQGQISVRHPQDPTTFFTSNVPAILVSGKSDLSHWHVADSSPVGDAYGGCLKMEQAADDMELHAHSSIYAMYPGVQSVIHSHCLSAVVYGLCNSWNSMLQPSYLMAGFLGRSPPIFDIARFYDHLPQTHPRNLLVSNQFLGDAMAEMLRKSQDDEMRLVDGLTDLPEQKVVFQRGHGYTTWAQSIQDAVWRAIHVRRDADIQTAAMGQRESTDLEIIYLSEREAKDCEMTINHADKKHWLAWVAEAYRSGLYHNDLKDRLGAG